MVVAIDELVLAAVRLAHFVASRAQLAHHMVEGALLRRHLVEGRVGLVVDDEQVEGAVAIDVRQRERGTPGRCGETGLRDLFGEMTGAVVAEQRVRPAQGRHQQVQIAVAIDVGKGATSRKAVRRSDAGAGRDVFEAPPPAIPIQRVGAFGAGEEHVRESVTIHVGEAHAGALRQNPVLQEEGIAHRIDEGDARAIGVQGGESRFATARNFERPRAIAVFRLPGGVDATAARGGQEESGNDEGT